jgi:hypothetical protein
MGKEQVKLVLRGRDVSPVCEGMHRHAGGYYCPLHTTLGQSLLPPVLGWAGYILSGLFYGHAGAAAGSTFGLE